IPRELFSRNLVGRARRARQSAERFLENKDSIPYAYEVFHARSIPVCQANAAVTGGAPDGFGIVRAVNADARLVQTHPENPDEIVRTRRKIVIIFSAHTVIEHSFIVAAPVLDLY